MNVQEALTGPTFFKFAYVTNDRDQAIERFRDRLGVEEWVPFDPQFEATLSDGRRGHAHLRCAFSKGQPNVIEVMEPHEGLVDLWAEPLAGANGFALVFHHIGHVVDDLEAVKRSFAEHGIDPVLESTIPVGTFAYMKLPGLGHWVEYMQYFGDGGKFLESVRAPT